MHEKIDGTVIAVTGASSGIGEATAEYLAARGARLVLGARRSDRLDDLVDRIRAAGGVALGVVTDVTKRRDMVKLVQEAVGQYGRLDVLVSNAGYMAISSFDRLEQDKWDEMIAVHVTGLLNGIAAALPVFRSQNSGQFITIGSTAAYVVKSPQGVYAGSKMAVKAITEGLRQESGPNLRVTLVSPGFTNTGGIGKDLSPGDAEAVLRTRDAIAMPPSAIASAIGYAIEQPAGIDISEIIVRPTAQP